MSFLDTVWVLFLPLLGIVGVPTDLESHRKSRNFVNAQEKMMFIVRVVRLLFIGVTAFQASSLIAGYLTL